LVEAELKAQGTLGDTLVSQEEPAPKRYKSVKFGDVYFNSRQTLYLNTLDDPPPADLTSDREADVLVAEKSHRMSLVKLRDLIEEFTTEMCEEIVTQTAEAEFSATLHVPNAVAHRIFEDQAVALDLAAPFIHKGYKCVVYSSTHADYPKQRVDEALLLTCWW
jgi:hypothetical protein